MGNKRGAGLSNHAVPIAVLLGAVLLVAGKYLLFGVPHEFITGEYKGTFEGDYDFTLELAGALARWGRLPLWSETYSGPVGVFASNLHVFAQAALYPFTKNLALSIKLLQAGQLITAGIGMYALARHVFKSRPGAVFSGLLYMFSPFYIGHLLSYLHYTGVYMLAPLVFLFTLKTIRERSLPSALALALTAAVSFLLHPQNVFIGGLFYALFFVMVLAHELVESGRKGEALGAAARLVPLGLLVVVVGGLLTAYLAYPTLTDNYPYLRTSWVEGAEELVKVDTGHIGTHSQNVLASVTLQHWPWFQTPLKGGEYPPWPYMAVYLIPFAFAAVSLLLRFDWLTMVFVVMAAVSVQLSLGVNGTPDLFTLASRHIPFFGMSRTPYSYVTTAILVFCLLASVTFAWLMEKGHSFFGYATAGWREGKEGEQGGQGGRGGRGGRQGVQPGEGGRTSGLFSWVFLGVAAAPYLLGASYYGVEYNWTFIPARQPAYLEQVWSWMRENNTERGRAIETCGIPTAMILGSRMLPNQVDLLERFSKKSYLDKYLALLGLNYVITPRLHSQRAVTFDKKGYMVPSVFDRGPSMEEYYSALTTEYYHIYERLAADPAFTMHTAGTKDVAVFELNDPVDGYELYPARAVMVLGGVDAYDLLALGRFAYGEAGGMPPAPVFIAQEKNLEGLASVARVSGELVLHNTGALDLFVTLERGSLNLFQPRPVDPALWDLSIFSFGIQQPFPQHDHAIGNSLFGELTHSGYALTSRVRGATLSGGFEVSATGRYRVMLRSYGGPGRAPIDFAIDDRVRGSVGQSEAAGYRWLTLWEGELDRGAHTVELGVAGDGDVFIDSVLVMDPERPVRSAPAVKELLASAPPTYIQNHKRFVATGRRASTEVDIAGPGSLVPSLRLGRLAPDPDAPDAPHANDSNDAPSARPLPPSGVTLLVDGEPAGTVPYGAVTGSLAEFVLPEVELTPGPHTFTLTGLDDTLLLELLALAPARLTEPAPLPPRGFTFARTGPSEYGLELGIDKPVLVVFNETNYPGWQLRYVEGGDGAKAVEPVVTNMFLNGFIIDPAEGPVTTARISYANRHQRAGLLASGSTLGLVVAGLVVSGVLGRRRRNKSGRGV